MTEIWSNLVELINIESLSSNC